MAVALVQSTTANHYTSNTTSGDLLICVEQGFLDSETSGALVFNAPVTSGFTWTLAKSAQYDYIDIIDNNPCFTGNVKFKVPKGFVRFDEVERKRLFRIENEAGFQVAHLLIHDVVDREMLDLGDGQLVTLEHHLKREDGTFCRAESHPATKDLPRLKFTGRVYNLHIYTEDPAAKHYILENGLVAHNDEEK